MACGKTELPSRTRCEGSSPQLMLGSREPGLRSTLPRDQRARSRRSRGSSVGARKPRRTPSPLAAPRFAIGPRHVACSQLCVPCGLLPPRIIGSSRFRLEEDGRGRAGTAMPTRCTRGRTRRDGEPRTPCCTQIRYALWDEVEKRICAVTMSTRRAYYEYVWHRSPPSFLKTTPTLRSQDRGLIVTGVLPVRAMRPLVRRLGQVRYS